MSYGNWQNSFSARLRRAEWNLKHGRSVLSPGTKLSTLNAKPSTSKSEPAPQPTALPGDDNGAAAASTLPAAASPSAAALSSAGTGAAAPAREDARPTTAKLGLRYER